MPYTKEIVVRGLSEAPIDFILMEDDTPIDMTDVANVKLVLKSEIDEAVTVYSTDDVTPVLTIEGAVTDGLVRLSPVSGTFISGENMFGYFVIVDTEDKEIPYPEGYDFYFIVRESFED